MSKVNSSTNQVSAKQKVTLPSSQQSTTNAGGSTNQSTEMRSSTNGGGSEKKSGKIMITGDDILIEYVTRLVKGLQQTSADKLERSHFERMEKFISHYVWHQPDMVDGEGLPAQMPQRLGNRLTEMTDRRRRLIKYMFKKEGRIEQFESQYPLTIRKKQEVINKFSSGQLEELLNNSTKNVAQEVVTCLIPKRGEGVLTSLEKRNSLSGPVKANHSIKSADSREFTTASGVTPMSSHTSGANGGATETTHLPLIPLRQTPKKERLTTEMDRAPQFVRPVSNHYR